MLFVVCMRFCKYCIQSSFRLRGVQSCIMGLEKKTIKIIVIVIITLVVIGGIIGLLLALLLPQRYVELEVWPRSEEYGTWEQPMIQFRADDPGSWHPWVRRINDFLRVYETTVPEDRPRAPCSTRHHRDQQLRSPGCDTAMRMWAPCTADYFYGYEQGSPCVFLRLGHIHYWVPEPYNLSLPLPLPPEMPENIMRHMRDHPAYKYGDHVWLSCEGEYNADKENIGPIQYIPATSLPGFPTRLLHTADRISSAARNMPDQEPGPLIAVYFERPRRGVLISVECRVWTRDLYYYYDRYTRIGRTRFELYID